METAVLLGVTAAAVPFPSSRDPFAQGCIKRPHRKYNQRQSIVRVSRPDAPMEAKIRIPLPTCSVSGPVSKAQRKNGGEPGTPGHTVHSFLAKMQNPEPSKH